ncbi:hypothetical protein C2S53_000436 [Perilla frutescens var. hirtella]|uniref:Uncharacterized protein n=1 Tax=Perilla frutescens var. hirtella TaxID=608512 RepID=A0AAD4P350_PERFH|nr:hypothetical protein C2S53_000436 [Perilla frutescens var. hirtella]
MDTGSKLDFPEVKRRRLVLFPLPFQGHINPMMQLAHILHCRGFSISIIHTQFNLPDPSKYTHFTFHVISDALPESETSISDPILLIKTLTSNCMQPFKQCLAQICSNDRVVCLVTDAIWHFTQAVADELELPRIVLRTASVCSFYAFAALPFLREKGYLSERDSKMEAEIGELPPLKVKDIPLIETKNPEDLYEVVDSMVRETQRASCLVFNTFQELEGEDLAKLREKFLMPTFAIGPFHKYFSAATSSILKQDRSSVSWLDTRATKSVLYVSFGSVAAMDEKDLVEVAWGLANSMQPFLWVVRPGLVHGGGEWLDMLPNEFLNSVSERSHIVKWAPQQEVLSHPAVAGFWTHSGWNSTVEAICEGIPMICSPFFGDQMVNSRYVSDTWKIGMKLEKGMERGEIEGAIRRLMIEKEGEEIRQRVECLKEKAGVCLTEGGSSYQALDGFVDLISSFESPA